MNIGMIGLGKLGLPVAVALGYRGHRVVGYDIKPPQRPHPQVEAGVDDIDFEALAEEHWPETALEIKSVALACDLIFVAVQTPHEERYCGAYRTPADRRDFDYTHLKQAVRDIAPYLEDRHTLVIISTCMPGTVRREILPLVSRATLVYGPMFIAMGTVIPDYLAPEFCLVGVDDVEHPNIGLLTGLYDGLYEDTSGHAYHRIMSYESAELTKVAYNAFIGFKIGLANTFGLLCDRIPGAEADDVMDCLKLATDRLISPAYLAPGMGDGGACHPRDLIAMSWAMNQHFTRLNPFDDVMRWRETHAEILAYRLVAEASKAGSLPMAIYGLSFKANTGMLDGSHAILVRNILAESVRNIHEYDPIAGIGTPVDGPHCILLGCRHEALREKTGLGRTSPLYPEGSVVIDPFRYMPDLPGVKVIRLGEG